MLRPDIAYIYSNARVYGHTTTAMHEHESPPPTLPETTVPSWNNETTGEKTYRGQLEAVNSLLADMENVLGGVGFQDIENPYNFEQARNLTNATVSDASVEHVGTFDTTFLLRYYIEKFDIARPFRVQDTSK